MIPASKIISNALEIFLKQDGQLLTILSTHWDITVVARELETYCRSNMPKHHLRTFPMLDACLDELFKGVLWVDVVHYLRQTMQERYNYRFPKNYKQSHSLTRAKCAVQSW